MELYGVLRLSLYAMVASGAFALLLAEPGHRPLYLLAVIALAALAHRTVDRGRVRPRAAFVYVLALAFLVSYLLPLRDEHDWHRQSLFAIAHFLCIFQALLFFVPYRGSVLLVSGASTLAIVIVSGVMDPGATLLLRMPCCVATTTWAMLVHSLWRGRESFLGQDWVISARNHLTNGDTGRPDVISDRALRQGLALAASLTASCLVLGLLLFFTAPRVNETLTGWIEAVVDKRQPAVAGENAAPALGRPPDGVPVTTGNSDTVPLAGLGPIHHNQGPALAVTFSRLSDDVTDGHGRILLRGRAYSRLENGVWEAATDAQPQDATRALTDPSAPGIKYRGEEIRQTVEESEALHSGVCFTVGPPARLNPPQVAVDSEGVLRTASNAPSIGRYEVWSYPPPQAKLLPENAEAVHPDRARYLRDGLAPNVQQDVRDRAHAITKDCATPLQKIRKIMAHLRDSGQYAYTTRLNELKRTGDPVAEFLLSSDPRQQRGHCGYFAAAFVVLCRLNNIPARLASGYAAPLPARPSGAPGDADDGAAPPQEARLRVVFRNADAHAWGEVFFKDVGWVAFDPTPPAPPPAPEANVAAAPAPGAEKPAAAAAPGVVQRIWEVVI
ncbi:MAG: transglutaminaseTgpA domain-containing protein, partial [Planctomycetota bacterium]|nr:transglutaminaseTgpA domain-containing protein [Planctomycetota bacterium]